MSENRRHHGSESDHDDDQAVIEQAQYFEYDYFNILCAF